MKAEDRIGTVINGWKIVEITGKRKNRQTLFKAISTITGRIIENVTPGSIQENKYSHNACRHIWVNKRLFSIYQGMKARCYRPSSKNYSHYGKRGIIMCKEWLDNPKAFEEWALEYGYQDGLTIDRIRSDGNYEPTNCRWISLSENSKWTKNTTHIWIENYLDSGIGWSLKIGKNRSWFSGQKHSHGFDYAYQRLLEEIEKLGGIKKIMGVSEEHDMSQFLEDIENDCLEVDL